MLLKTTEISIFSGFSNKIFKKCTGFWYPQIHWIWNNCYFLQKIAQIFMDFWRYFYLVKLEGLGNRLNQQIFSNHTCAKTWMDFGIKIPAQKSRIQMKFFIFIIQCLTPSLFSMKIYFSHTLSKSDSTELRSDDLP